MPVRSRPQNQAVYHCFLFYFFSYNKLQSSTPTKKYPLLLVIVITVIGICNYVYRNTITR